MSSPKSNPKSLDKGNNPSESKASAPSQGSSKDQPTPLEAAVQKKVPSLTKTQRRRRRRKRRRMRQFCWEWREAADDAAEEAEVAGTEDAYEDMYQMMLPAIRAQEELDAWLMDEAEDDDEGEGVEAADVVRLRALVREEKEFYRGYHVYRMPRRSWY